MADIHPLRPVESFYQLIPRMVILPRSTGWLKGELPQKRPQDSTISRFAKDAMLRLVQPRLEKNVATSLP